MKSTPEHLLGFSAQTDALIQFLCVEGTGHPVVSSLPSILSVEVFQQLINDLMGLVTLAGLTIFG